jgi:hypothetical protein
VPKLTGKTIAELEALLADTSREQLIKLLHQYTSPNQLLSARQIAAASGVDKRDVIADMKAGRFRDPILGPGFFCRHPKLSRMRVSAAAVADWERQWFHAWRSIPVNKKDGDQRGRISVDAKKAAQRRTGPNRAEMDALIDEILANGGCS